jgi:adenosylhomocysteine nucleosidase
MFMDDSPILVCFAVKEEARFFHGAGFERLITGMGRKNAAESIRKALAALRPQLVITAGFAGGLNPELSLGTVVYDEDFEAGVGEDLLSSEAVPGKFYCSRRVAITAAEKLELWKTTGADAVEMESSVIRTICREQKILSATVRVISDPQQDDLPLDFNALMTSNDRINFAKLIWQLLSRPQNIPRLMKFQEQTVFAARNLGQALERSLARR